MSESISTIATTNSNGMTFALGRGTDGRYYLSSGCTGWELIGGEIDTDLHARNIFDDLVAKSKVSLYSDEDYDEDDLDEFELGCCGGCI